MHFVVPPDRTGPSTCHTPFGFTGPLNLKQPTIPRYPVTRYHCDFRLTNTVLSTILPRHHRHNPTHHQSQSLESCHVYGRDLTKHYCPPGSQLILACDVQAACIQSPEPDLPDTLQQSFSQLVSTQPVALPTSYSFGASVFSVSPQSATAFRENPGVAEKPLPDNSSNEHTFGTSMSPQLPPQLTSQPRPFEPSTLSVPNPNPDVAENLLSTDNNNQHRVTFRTPMSPSRSPLQSQISEPSTSRVQKPTTSNPDGRKLLFRCLLVTRCTDLDPLPSVMTCRL
ncbi:hypothetical protein K435DRAFT_873648 [Dendrothele bispora CBS 962.96]|uniref:Uncharacterized protein n=1 Tax=Dendrothele bispora (strain CBS 962.96) TaxID=1314807 RepID=A0A4S8KYZ6_DENBC|nr:hypothetical protein K435DRAFT_873648 [Dendrothele bispora CBS 962.96]